MPTLPTSEDRRLEMLDGLPIIRADPSVPAGTRNKISCMKTFILLKAFVLAGVGIFFVSQVDPSEEVEVHPLTLTMPLCPPEARRIVGKESGTNAGLNSVLRTKSHKVFKFMPVSKYAVPSVTYYESEELHAEPEQTTYAYSLTLFGMREEYFNVELDDRDVSCLPQDIDELNDAAGNAFGAAVVNEILAADRRTPRSTLPLVPMSHGGLVVQHGENRMWSVSLGKFDQKYHRSTAMSAYWWIVNFLRVAGTGLGVLAISRAVFHTWWRATEHWVLQYDFLWQQSDLNSSFAHAGMVDFSKIDVKKMARDKHAWSLAHMCGVFWVVDHAVGNPILNAERWGQAFASAWVHAFAMVGLAVLPVVHASFFEGWRIFVFSLVAGHLLQCFGFGTAYFFQLALHKRQGFYYGYLFTAGSLAVYSVWYLNSIALFLATRLVVAPNEAGGAVGSMGGLVVYAVAMTVGLRHLRHRVVSRMFGKESKGKLDAALTKTGLDTRSLVTRTAAGAIGIGLLGSMLVLVGDLYFERSGASQLFAVVVTVSLGTFAFLKQFQSRYQSVLQLEGDVDDF